MANTLKVLYANTHIGKNFIAHYDWLKWKLFVLPMNTNPTIRVYTKKSIKLVESWIFLAIFNIVIFMRSLSSFMVLVYYCVWNHRGCANIKKNGLGKILCIYVDLCSPVWHNHGCWYSVNYYSRIYLKMRWR